MRTKCQIILPLTIPFIVMAFCVHSGENTWKAVIARIEADSLSKYETNLSGRVTTIRLSSELSCDVILQDLTDVGGVPNLTLKPGNADGRLSIKGFETIGRMPTITNLSLMCFPQVPKGALVSVCRSATINTIRISAQNIDVDELIEISNTNIVSIHITATNINNDVVQRMKLLNSIRRLYVYSPGISKSITNVLKHHANIELLSVGK